MKKNSFSVIFFVWAICLFSACKEEEVNDQQFVENHFIGKWPLKVAIFKTTKNGTVIVDSTVKYGVDTPITSFPIDTISFTKDGDYTRKGDTVKYSIDGTGDNVTYSTAPPETWKIKYLRSKSIILTQEKTEKKGSDTFIYYKEEQLIK